MFSLLLPFHSVLFVCLFMQGQPHSVVCSISISLCGGGGGSFCCLVVCVCAPLVSTLSASKLDGQNWMAKRRNRIDWLAGHTE